MSVKIQYDPRGDHEKKQAIEVSEGRGEIIDCANYDSLDRSDIGKLSEFPPCLLEYGKS
jgi:hypothetical protein